MAKKPTVQRKRAVNPIKLLAAAQQELRELRTLVGTLSASERRAKLTIRQMEEGLTIIRQEVIDHLDRLIRHEFWSRRAYGKGDKFFGLGRATPPPSGGSID